jgi:catechol 2,3-dioxygenase-like lactoylglutathione lyase family enzyme
MASKPQGSYSIVIKAIDATTTVVAKINKGLFNQTKVFRDINKATSTLGREFTRFGKITGITYVAKQVSTLGGHIANAAKSTLNFFDKLVSLSGLLTVGGIVAAIRQFSSYSKELSNNARQIGITPKALQSWQQIGEYAAGIAPETMTNNLQGLSKTIEDSIFGRDNEASSYFTKMGIQLTDVHGEAKDAGTVLDELRHKFSQMAEGPGKAAAKLELMNKLHLGADIEPFLNVSDAGIDEAKKKVKGYNNISPGGIAIAEKYRKAMVSVSLAAKDLSTAVAESLTPAFTGLLEALEPMVKSWADWIRLHQNDIIQTTTGWVKDLIINIKALWTQIDDYVAKSGGWEAVIKNIIEWVKNLATKIEDFGKKLLDVAKFFGGWEAVKYAAIAAGVTLICAALMNPLVLTALAAWTAYYVARKAYDETTNPESETNRGFNEAADEEMTPSVDEYGRQIGAYDKKGNYYSNEDLSKRRATYGKDSVDQEKSAQESYDFWKNKLGPAGAAAMVAQEKAESGFDYTNKTGDSGEAHGLYQHHADRREAILKGKGINIDTATAEQQREGAWWEMNNTAQGKRALAEIRAAGNNSYGTGGAASQYFEAPGDQEGEKTRRGALSRAYRAKFDPEGAKTETPGPPPLSQPLPPLIKQSQLGGSADINVAFNGFPPGLFSTTSSSKNANLNTARTAGPVFA